MSIFFRKTTSQLRKSSRCYIRKSSVLWLLLLSNVLPAQSQADPNFKVSNDHGRFSGSVAFTAMQKENPNQKQVNQIYIADLVKRTVSLHSNQDAESPALSPDGNKIAYSTTQGVLEVAALNTISPKTAINTRMIARAPSWSNDSKSVVFHASETSNSGSNIFKAQLASSENAKTDSPEYRVKKITKLSGKNTTAQLSPDGNRVAFSTNRFWPGWDICIWNISKNKESCVLGGNLSVFKPNWHPSEDILVFSAGSGEEFNLTKHNLTSGVRKELTTLPGREFDPSWSSDAAYVIFSAEINVKGNFDIYILEVESGEIFPLIESKLSLRHPSWHQNAQSALSGKNRTKGLDVNSDLEAQKTYRPGYLDGTSN